MTRTPGEKLKRMIEYGIDYNSSGQIEAAFDLLGRVAPETMSQQQVARRWPRILAAMIVESGGYFTPESAANALLAHKLKIPFGCEYYCFSAGFERDGWPKDRDVYRSKLVQTGRNVLRRATQCQCLKFAPWRTALEAAVPEHKYGRHAHSGSRSVGQPGTREMALTLVKQLAEQGSSRAQLASWF